ncbi:MAG: iron-containing alcohol dehydrogenase family protein [Clostridia bacterium]|jgi:alcohol dehydrogenase class IV
MEIKSFMPVKIIFGKDCVLNNKDVFKSTGRFPLIVTGKSGAKKSGAFDDVMNCLNGGPYLLYDRIEENPKVSTVEDAAMMSKKFNCDYIIAIGGGSALDAAKAIAVLAVNNMSGMELFTKRTEKALPIIAIPTTSGTGSEVTPYSILTVDDWQTKKSFASDYIYPKYALLDPQYTYSLSADYTISTAFDAASHLFESYFSLKSTSFSQMYSVEGIHYFSKAVNAIQSRQFDEKSRNDLMYASMLGGIAISHTGTTAMHALGYSMTYFHKMPHGFSNLYFVKPYFQHMMKYEKDKTVLIIEKLGFSDIYTMCDFFLGNMQRPKLNEDQCRKYASLAMMQSSIKATPGNLTEEDIAGMYKEAGGL